MGATRTETDSFGPIEVPADSYWGAQTERSIGNFPFGPSERMPVELIHALGFVNRRRRGSMRGSACSSRRSPRPSSKRPRKSRGAISTGSFLW